MLRGLAEGATGDIIRAAGGTTPSAELVDLVHGHTEGNPLFVHETVRLLAGEGLLTSERMADVRDWEFRLPEGVREVIGRRTARLSKECREVLGVAAVVGREFRADLLAGLREAWSGELLLVLLEEAAAAHLVVESAGRPGVYEFSHALIHRTLAETLSPTRRARLHAEVAQALEAMYGARSDDHAAELASHYSQAEAVTGPGPVVRYSLAAGEKALAAYAFEDGVAHFERALEAQKQAGGPEDEVTARLLDGLGRCSAHKGRLPAALESLWQAFDLYVKQGNVRAALGVGRFPYPFPLSTRYLELLERALKFAAPGSLDEGWLLSAYGRSNAGDRGDFAKGIEYQRRAVVIAREHGDIGLEMWALGRAVTLYYLVGQHEEAIASAAAAMALAPRGGPLHAAVHTLHWDSMAYAALGRFPEAVVKAEACMAEAEKTKAPFRLMQGLGAMTTVAAARGDWEAALELSARMSRIGAGGPGAPPNAAFRAYLLAQTGQAGEARDLLAWALREVGTAPEMTLARRTHIVFVQVPLIAHVLAEDVPEAVYADLKTIADQTKATPNTAQLLGAAGLAAVMRPEPDVDLARRGYRALAYTAGRAASGSWGFFGGALIVVDRERGLLAAALGDLKAAGEHFEAAAAFSRKAGYLPELAWTCHDHADMLLAKTGALDAPEAARIRVLLDEGEPLAQRLSMVPLSARLAALREKLASRRGGRPDYPDGLTEREVEVLRLVAAGKSNREIGEALVISENTVIRHVSNIFAKVGAANRAEATAYAARRGLLAK